MNTPTLRRRHHMPRSRQQYFAVWLGIPQAAMLLTTTVTAQKARRLVRNIRSHDGDAFYSSERGPIVRVSERSGATAAF